MTVIIETITCVNTSKLFSHTRLMLLPGDFIVSIKALDGGLLTDLLLFTDYK
jgi:hypothetical protein